MTSLWGYLDGWDEVPRSDLAIMRQSMAPLVCPPRVALLAVAAAAIACRAAEIASLPENAQTTTTIATGEQLRITVGTIGPGSYDSLPSISSSALRFLDMTYPPGQVPAGPTQLFRFVGIQTGTAIISFHQSFTNRLIEDTIVVR